MDTLKNRIYTVDIEIGLDQCLDRYLQNENLDPEQQRLRKLEIINDMCDGVPYAIDLLRRTETLVELAQILRGI